MTPDELGRGIKYLKAFYTKWDFDVTNTFALQVWYKCFKDVEFETFQKIIQDYCFNNQYAPNSPNDLLKLIPRYLSTDEACELIRDIVSRNVTPEYFMRELYSNNQCIYGAVKGMEDEFYRKDSFEKNCVGYALKMFKRRYQTFLDQQRVAYVGKNLIENKNQILLGE